MANIVLLGAPGAGKDTLALQLQNKFSCKLITPGTIFRREADLGTPLGLRAKNEYWGKGHLCPDEITNELVKNTLERLSKNQTDHTIFNGYPRSLVQAEFLQEINSVDLALDLSVTKDTSIKRLLSRRREDDTREVIEKRFQAYLQNNSAVVDYYKELGIYASINADQMIPRVLKSALGKINLLGER